MFNNSFPFFFQIEQTDCGATCLKTILKYYGKDCDTSYLRELTEVTRTGVSLADIHSAAQKLHFHSTPFRITVDNLKQDVHLPCILHWEQDHFVVLYKIKDDKFYISDPKFGKVILKHKEFLKLWQNNNKDGIGIQLIPKEEFLSLKLPVQKDYVKNLAIFFKQNLVGQRQKIFWIVLLTLISTIISYILPQAIKEMFDSAYSKNSTNILISVFVFQLVLFLGQSIVNTVQNFVGIHFSSQVSIKMLNGLLNKVVKLPVSFFENKLYSEILQKIDDQNKIETLLTRQFIGAFFSLTLFICLEIRLFVYNKYIALGMLLFVIVSIFWISLFYNNRRKIDYYAFRLNSENKNQLVELVTGMVSVKISNAHFFKIVNWQETQKKIYDNRVKSLILENYQTNVISVLKQFVVLFITFLCTYWVIKGKLTIGEMISIGYIIGIISSQAEFFFNFFKTIQDAKLVYDRTLSIYSSKDENENLKKGDPVILNQNITISNMYYKYDGASQPYVLKNINLEIENSNIIAIVGESGSGKSTLMKLLLNFYTPTKGEINIGNEALFGIDHDWWRDNCGVVMQDSYIFSGSIGDNISMEGDSWDEEKLIYACKLANIHSFIMNLPLKFNTKIGNSGSDLSGGQKQRILIARAVYKNPQFIFLDEATSALDAENEMIIHNNLNNFFRGKTVVIIAHRLSTVKNADKIITLKNGEVVEEGNHEELIFRRGEYYNLVKNQLELSK